MAVEQDLFTNLAACIQDVAAGHGTWREDVLVPIARLLDVENATIDVFDKRRGDFHFLATQPVDEGDRRYYEEHLYASNPRFSLIPKVRVGEIAADRDIDPEIDAAAGEFYDWMERATGTRYFAGIKLIESNDYLALTSIGITVKRGRVTPDVEAAYARLAPHLTNALAVHLALAGRERLDMVEEDASGRAYALLDREGRVLECSAAFEAIGAAADAFTLRHRRLEAARTADKPALARLIAGATADEPLAPVRLQRGHGRQGLLLRAVRLSRSRELFNRLRPVAMLVIIDLDAPLAAAQAELRAGWGLTGREAELAMLIGEGRRLDQAAALLGISEQTARHHLKSIFRRMEIDRQTDLVRLVTRLGA